MLGLLSMLIAYQSIFVNSTKACFLNQTAGIDMFQNCGLGKDWIQAVLISWEWITGGYFTFVLVSVLVIMIYIKYEKMIYSAFFGVVFLPLSFFLFPIPLISTVIILGLVGLGLLIGFAFVSQTNE